ncbi:MAG: malonyl-CoA decarboxylase [Shimia sp.]|uniref:malonyl-CoA decarboxylase n=1 Tax=Shimia sp. TaxID=1954381 RepID=UPI004059413F
MQQNWFLGDLLAQLFDRRGQLHGKDDARSITELCEALLSAEGEVSGYQLASTVLDRYRALGDDEKILFFKYLNEELEIDAVQIADLAHHYADNRTIESFKALSEAVEPRRQELLRRLNQPTGATQDLVAMRVDLLRIVKTHPDLRRTDLDFVHLLRSWFNRGFLVLKQINWDTPARILDKVVAYEAVHQISDLEDLRRRLYPPDRRCFAFFHPSMPDQPLIFVEVALTATVPGSIDDVLSEQRDPLEASQAQVAVFYSISNCQKGLAGISFGNFLIKQVVTELALELPSIQTYVTLSPIPGFNTWLESQREDDALGYVSKTILAGTAPSEDLRAMTARYLLNAKRKDGLPIDPVARFHLGNGAEVHDLHASADTSRNGLAQSSGAMVNYLYELKSTEQNHEEFAMHGTIAASRTVHSLAGATLLTKPKETTA